MARVGVRVMVRVRGGLGWIYARTLISPGCASYMVAREHEQPTAPKIRATRSLGGLVHTSYPPPPAPPPTIQHVSVHRLTIAWCAFPPGGRLVAAMLLASTCFGRLASPSLFLPVSLGFAFPLKTNYIDTKTFWAPGTGF